MIATANDNPQVGIVSPHAKQATALNFFASTIICWSILVGAFVVDQMLPAQNTGKVIAILAPSATEVEMSVAVSAAQVETLAPTRYSKAMVVQSWEPGFVGRLKDAGAVTVLGNARYYQRFGFTRSSAEALETPFSRENTLLYPIRSENAGIMAELVYPAAYSRL